MERRRAGLLGARRCMASLLVSSGLAKAFDDGGAVAFAVPASQRQEAVDGVFHRWAMIGGLLYVAVLGAGQRE